VYGNDGTLGCLASTDVLTSWSSADGSNSLFFFAIDLQQTYYIDFVVVSTWLPDIIVCRM
jgi:hypothetical protein